MDPSLDLVDHFKLETAFLPEHTLHTYYKSDSLDGRRKVKIVKRWRKTRIVGEGNFGSVWLESEEDGSERAVKAISRRLCSHNSIDYTKEVAAMARLSKHEELFVKLHGWYEDKDSVFLAMEYFRHGDLQRHMNEPMAETQVKIIAIQLLEGLKTMHELCFTHRDLKPQNIFVVNTEPFFWVKIGDFGITKRIMSDQTFLKTEIGTREYLAPEVLGYVDEETSYYTNAVDIWSLGCICHRLLTTEPPFAKITALAPYCWGGKDLPIDALQKATVSEEGILFVRKLMAPQPSERLDAEAALQSLWLEDVDSLEPKLALEPAPSRSVSYEQDRSSYDIANVNSAARIERCETPSNTIKRKREKWCRQELSRNGSEEASQASSITESEDETSDSETPSEPQQEWTPNSISLQAFLNAGFLTSDYRVEVKGYATEAFEWATKHATTLDLYALLIHDPPLVDVQESLCWAVRQNNLSVVRAIFALPKVKVDINVEGSNGLTPLHWSCRCMHEDITRFLLTRGADVTAHARIGGITPLHCLPFEELKRRGPIATLLEEYGADFELKDCEGRIPLDTAQAIVEPIIPELEEGSAQGILDPQGPPNQGYPIELSSESLTSDQCVLARFRAAGYNPHSPRVAPRAFAWAARQGAKDLMEYMLENITFKTEVLNMLLLHVAALGSSYAASRLIAKGANIDYNRGERGVYEDGRTPLQVACTFGNIHTAEFLLTHEANVHARDAMEQTALHKAAGGNGLELYRLDLVKALLDHGIDPSARNLEGKNAGQIARDKGRHEVARQLRNRIDIVEETPKDNGGMSVEETLSRLNRIFTAIGPAKMR